MHRLATINSVQTTTTTTTDRQTQHCSISETLLSTVG